MNIDSKEIEKAKEEIAKLSDGELVTIERIVFDEMTKREAKKMILRLIDKKE